MYDSQYELPEKPMAPADDGARNCLMRLVRLATNLITNLKLQAILSTVLLTALLSQVALAYRPDVDNSPGSFLVTSDVGAALYRIDYADGYPDFVQLAYLDRGGAVKLLHGKNPTEYRRYGGSASGRDPRFSPGI